MRIIIVIFGEGRLKKERRRRKKGISLPERFSSGRVFLSKNNLHVQGGKKPTTRTVLLLFSLPFFFFPWRERTARSSVLQARTNRSRDFKSPFRWLRRDSSVPCYFSPPRFIRFIPFSPQPFSPLFSFHSPLSRILRF